MSESINHLNRSLLECISVINKPLISPMSIFFAMALVYLGSKNNTKNELQRVLNIHQSDPQLLSELIKLNSCQSSSIKFVSSNAFLFHKGFKVNVVYLHMFEQLGQMIPFQQPSEAITLSNQWVDNKTNHMIPEILQPSDVDSDTCMVLLNAIYFKARWAIEFRRSETFKESFFGLTMTKPLDTMHITSKYMYAEDESTQYLQLPYVDRTFALIVALPKNGTTTIDLTGLNDPQIIFKQPYQTETVAVSLPKFEHRQRLYLRDHFEKLGIRDLFTDKADLSVLTPQKNVCVTKIIHEVVVKIDEEGTEAAAATAVVGARCLCARPSVKIIPFKANHSFYYAIVNKTEQMILFNGIYTLA